MQNNEEVFLFLLNHLIYYVSEKQKLSLEHLGFLQLIVETNLLLRPQSVETLPLSAGQQCWRGCL